METSGGQNEYKLAGYFARLNYDFKGRYLIELNGRYDGSSRFLRGSRWVFSPSASLGWRVSEEPFFAPLRSWWDNFKIRFSYGQLGNQQMSSYYPAIRTVSTSGKSSYLLGGANLPQASLSAPVSSGLTWERSLQSNLGVDLAFLGNRLEFSAEGYIRDTKDMLTAGEPLPSVPKAISVTPRTCSPPVSLSRLCTAHPPRRKIRPTSVPKVMNSPWAGGMPSSWAPNPSITA